MFIKIQKMLEIEAGLINQRDDRCWPGKTKMFETETGLMNYRHDKCISGKSKCSK